MTGIVARLITDVPVEPDQPDAVELLIDELSKPVYQAARPTLFDEIARSIFEWLQSLQAPSVDAPPALGFAVVIVIVAVALVVAFLVFGLPRLNRRSAVAGTLFGDDDARTAQQIREDAERAAAAGDHSTAVLEMFRAIARGLAERTLVSVSPGTTANGFAVRAGTVFPAEADRLVSASAVFDEVRYLDRTGNEQQFRAVAELERDLRTARPVLAGPVAVG